MNTNMRFITLIFLLIAPSFVAAQKFDNLAYMIVISPVYIELIDNANGGCWTNLMEAKNYAAGQVDIAGGKVVETSQEAYSIFSINVIAERMDSGRCFGTVIVSFYRPDWNEGVGVLTMWSQYARAAVQLNFNNFTLDVIKEGIEEWKF